MEINTHKVMQEQALKEQISRLKEVLKRKNSENKKLRQQVKYNKNVKSRLKAENKKIKNDFENEVKKTSNKKKHLSEQRKANLKKRIVERFPDENIQSVLLELVSSYTSESSAASEE